MCGYGWTLLLSAALLGSAASYRTYFVLPPAGPVGADSAPLTLRTRRMGERPGAGTGTALSQPVSQSMSQTRHGHQVTVSGINVCGGQCCHGWSQAPGSQRCTKPNCQPQCQNGGMCLRPQLCVCKPGSEGKACEHKTPNPVPGNERPPQVVPQRPIPQQAAPPSTAHITLTVKQSQQSLPPLTRTAHQSHTQQFVIQPKYYHSVEQPAQAAVPLSSGQTSTQGANGTGRIRVVFTPSICKMTCVRGQCQNSCEMGNTTTIISENGHATDTLTASNFRVVVCHLPCINGGRCSSRDRCQCPPNFTGKFCQVPVPGAEQRYQSQSQQVSLSHRQGAQVHSTHTLPLTYGGSQNQVKFTPNIVNIHVHHPPEASVKIHQVSQLDSNGQTAKGSQSAHYSYHSETGQKQQVQQSYTNQQAFIQHYPITSKRLGRCFQETTGTQCGKLLPGLSKQEECCNSIGTSWGFHKCQKCPRKPSIPLTDSRHATECPQGYTRVNSSYCQDVNECQLVGVCANGDCMNTVGSYRCLCKAGFMPDHTLASCIPGVGEEKGACFRLVGSGRQCLHPVSVQLSKQLCCCSVGKAWGPQCDRCPVPGTAAFKDICPGGMGYTVSGTYRPKPINRNPPIPLPSLHRPVEALSVTERQLPVLTAAPEQELVVLGVNNRSVVEFGQPQLSPGVVTVRMEPGYPEVVVKSSPPAPVAVLPSSASQAIAPTQLAEVNECALSPGVCGQGVCYDRSEGYTCICYDGYRPDSLGGTCEDVDECLESDVCGPDGFCVNTEGSFTCRRCESGYTMTRSGQCEDVNECLDPNGVCPNGVCTNTRGSYVCDACPEGYEGRGGQCVDVDECRDGSVCANGDCTNLEGYFVCMCHSGYELSSDGRMCTDVDECSDERVCTRGHCHNTPGSFTCTCGSGFTLAASDCEDVDECQERAAVCGTAGVCVNNAGSYLCDCKPGFRQLNGTSCQDVNECFEETELCGPHGDCLNTEGSFHCVCDQGFTPGQERHTCVDEDECIGGSRCLNATCVNTSGSYRCQCERGYRLHADNHTCLDVDECQVIGRSICGAWRCENTPGSYRCVVDCPPGHHMGSDGICEDVDECSLNNTACGSHGMCENSMGSFRCLCDRGFQEEADGHGCVDMDECVLLRAVCGEAHCENVEGSFLCLCPGENQEYDQITATCRPTPTASVPERKECYYNLNDENLCDNVLTSSVTIEECCCTLGAGWGDNCEVHPCPVQGTEQFEQMCPVGKGNIPTSDSELGEVIHKDANECELFGQEICKDGFCLNTEGSFECYCRQGLYYDDIKLQCLDIDECLDESICAGGRCVNSLGSFMCFCPPPLELDSLGLRCVAPPQIAEHREQAVTYEDICWMGVLENMTCNRPLRWRTTYTECCCMYGEAWGMDCALCPLVYTEDYMSMCNTVQTEWRRPYGRDALTAPEPQYHEAGPEYDPRPHSLAPMYDHTDLAYEDSEGSRADECGVLNGCENGRCVRVQQGYTCECHSGYTLDMSRMACVDVNECSDGDGRNGVCRNARCINTAGSYSCQCLPGFIQSAWPDYCVPE